MSPPSTESFSPKSRHTRLRIKTPVGWEGKSQNDRTSGDTWRQGTALRKIPVSAPGRMGGGTETAPTETASSQRTYAHRRQNEESMGDRQTRGNVSPISRSPVLLTNGFTILRVSAAQRIALRKKKLTPPRKNVPTPQGCYVLDKHHAGLTSQGWPRSPCNS